MNLDEFKRQFKFKPGLTSYVGVEREFFITDKTGSIVPRAKSVLSELTNPLPRAGSFSFELSACQIESQSIPCKDTDSIKQTQIALDAELNKVLKKLQLSKLCQEVAPDDIPLDVYPDPEGRYQQIAKSMSSDVLLAACQIIGTHFHVGLPDAGTALEVYNRVIQKSDELCRMGDNSNGRRLEIYQRVAPACMPQPYRSWEDFYTFAKENGFAKNPRNCWTRIRLTTHGTIEFRNFGVTDNIDKIVEWADVCCSLCLL